MKRKIIYSGLLCSLGLAMGCGDSDEGVSSTSSVFAAGEVSLENFPNLSGLVSQDDQNNLSLAVSGTPVALKNLRDDPDTYFFGGSVSALVDDNATPTDEIRGNMERGQAVCGMAANAGELINRLSGGTLCYMSNIAKLPSGSFDVTKESAEVTSANHSDLFKQGAEDKIVRVDLPMGEDGFQAAHIKIIGTNNSADKYKVDFFMCRGDSADALEVDNVETYEIDYAAGSYSRTEAYGGQGDQGDEYVGSMAVSAYLTKAADGSFQFDPSKDRIITQENNSSYVYDNATNSNKLNMNMRIDSEGKLHTLIYRTDESPNSSGSEKIWSMAEFTGSGLDLGLSQMAMKMDRTHTYMDNVHNADGVGGAVEWQDTAYMNTEEGSFYAAFESKDMAAESFFATVPTTKTFDKSAYDCGEEVDVAIEVDLGSEALAPVRTACEGTAEDEEGFHSMCYQGDVQTAFGKLYQNPQQ